LPPLAADTKDGTSNLSPGPKMLLGRMQQVKSPFLPFDLMTSASPSALVAEYESLCWNNADSYFLINIK